MELRLLAIKLKIKKFLHFVFQMDLVRRPIVVKLKRSGGQIVQGCDVYIGRQQSQGGWNLKKSKWHNQFTVKQYGDKCVELYKEELYQKVRDDPDTWLPELVSLEGLTLGCWCQTNGIGSVCHGNVIADLVVKVCEAGRSEEAMDAWVKEMWG